MGGVLTGTAFTKQFPTIDTTTGNGNATLQGFVVAIYTLGCWLGSLLTMVIAERLGRKRTIIVGASILAVGTVIQCSAYGLPQLMVFHSRTFMRI
jgi:MFS family permease